MLHWSKCRYRILSQKESYIRLAKKQFIQVPKTSHTRPIKNKDDLIEASRITKKRVFNRTIDLDMFQLWSELHYFITYLTITNLLLPQYSVSSCQHLPCDSGQFVQSIIPTMKDIRTSTPDAFISTSSPHRGIKSPEVTIVC